jgi:hypothetical protein
MYLILDPPVGTIQTLSVTVVDKIFVALIPITASVELAVDIVESPVPS